MATVAVARERGGIVARPVTDRMVLRAYLERDRLWGGQHLFHHHDLNFPTKHRRRGPARVPGAGRAGGPLRLLGPGGPRVPRARRGGRWGRRPLGGRRWRRRP